MSDRLITDSSLEWLARRLRMIGFDVACVAAGGLEAAFETARREGRVVVTLSARHPRRFADVAAFRVPRDPRAAVRAVVERFVPGSPPFRRCSACNAALVTRPAASAPAEVPESVRRAAGALEHCEGCGRWYWRGSHVTRLSEWLDAALVGSPRKPMLE